KEDIVVREGERARMIAINLPSPHEPEPPPARTGWQTAAIVSGGAGVVATGFFIGLAALGVSDRTRFGCDRERVPSLYSPVSTEFIAADVMLGVAIASIGATVVFWLLSR